MNTQFTSVHLVPKLNAAEDPVILNIQDLITTTAVRLTT